MTVAVVPGAIDKAAIDIARCDRLHQIISRQPNGYVPVSTTYSVSGEVYVGLWVLAMAYAYFRTGNTTYKTDALNEFNYVKTLADGNNVLVFPDDSSLIYRDKVFRTIFQCALAARFFRMAGDSATASTIIASCELWGKAWFDKMNSGAPFASIQRHGWDASNAVGAPVWAATTPITVGQRRAPTVGNGHVYEAQNPGFTGPAEPTWPTGSGSTVTDGDLTWLEVVSHVAWQANHAYTTGQLVIPPAANGRTYRCIVAGTSAGSAPTWPTGDQATVTDGGVTWRCTSITKPSSFATYTNNGTTYPSVGTADVDLNQTSEEAALWALLTTDPASATFNAGAYFTLAQTRITDITGLAQAFQVNGGRVPIGDPITPTDGRAMFDTIYGVFSAVTAATALRFTPGVVHADTSLFVSGAMDWMTAEHSTEPLAPIDHYGGSPQMEISEPGFAAAVYELLGRTNPLPDITYKGAFNLSASARWGFYIDYGPPEDSVRDEWQARVFQGPAMTSLLGLTLAPGAINATSAITASVVRLRPVTPAAISSTSSLSATIVRVRAVVPAAINSTSPVSASIVRLRPITAASITSTSALSASIVRLRPLTPAAIISTSTIAASLSGIFLPHRANLTLVASGHRTLTPASSGRATLTPTTSTRGTLT